MRSRSLVGYIAGLMTVALAAQEASAGRLAGNNGILQTGPIDHTATRIDTEVFGWSTDFSAFGAIVAHSRRGPLGGMRGEVMMVAWPVDDVHPIERIDIDVITAADLPHAPVMLKEVFDDGKSNLGDLDYNLARMYPMRPKKHRPDGWMKVDVLWDPVQLSKTDCQPAVAFILEANGERRFQPHQPVPDIRGGCQHMRLSHTRTYWGRADIAVAMARFDWSPDAHEISFRQPVSAKWSRARELQILVRAVDTRDSRTLQLAKSLGRWGRVRIEHASSNEASGFAVASDLKLLETRFANELALPRSITPVHAGADIVVTLGGDDPERPVARHGRERLSRR